MLIGYARISTIDQNLDLQKDALLAAGCARLFTDVASGANAQRPGLADALSHCRSGDVLVVWKLDRLGRSLPHLVETVRNLIAQGIGFKSLRENLDTTTSGGKLIFHIFASLAEFERDVIRERTQAGLSAARARGRLGGRPKGMDEKKKRAALALKKDRTRTVKDICQIVGISRNTYYKYTAEPKPASPDRVPERDRNQSARPRMMKVRLCLRVENNSKFVRGKGKAREAIEREVLVTTCNRNAADQQSAHFLTGIKCNGRALEPELSATEPAIHRADLQSSVANQDYLQLIGQASNWQSGQAHAIP